MSLGGLWHGAAWSYAVWGIFHGVGLAIERFFTIKHKSKARTLELTRSSSLWQRFFLDTLQIFAVFSFVSIGWLLFKLPRFDQAIDFLVTLVKNIRISPSPVTIISVLIFSLPVIFYHLPHFPTFAKQTGKTPSGKQNLFWRSCQDLLLGFMLFSILFNSGQSQEFIYFQF
jgi:alginate O-acetyltransferase complex protein AlgI